MSNRQFCRQQSLPATIDVTTICKNMDIHRASIAN